MTLLMTNDSNTCFESLAKPSSPFSINAKDINEISTKVHHRIYELEQQHLSPSESNGQVGKQSFAMEQTENLVGYYEK